MKKNSGIGEWILTTCCLATVSIIFMVVYGRFYSIFHEIYHLSENKAVIASLTMTIVVAVVFTEIGFRSIGRSAIMAISVLIWRIFKWMKREFGIEGIIAIAICLFMAIGVSICFFFV